MGVCSERQHMHCSGYRAGNIQKAGSVLHAEALAALYGLESSTAGDDQIKSGD